MAWTDLFAAASGTPPSARYAHGFTSAGGKLYVHGGLNFSGTLGRLPGIIPMLLGYKNDDGRGDLTVAERIRNN
jgi:hypothetical protein